MVSQVNQDRLVPQDQLEPLVMEGLLVRLENQDQGELQGRLDQQVAKE